jgi:peptidoglycan pentaglycine glycine transferase (the first glycine)
MQPFTGSAQAWNELIAGLPQPHLLQTWEWSQVKAPAGWQAMPMFWSSQEEAGSSRQPGKVEAAAMVLRRGLPVRGFASKMCVLYVPRGPLLDWDQPALRRRVLNDLEELARQQGAIFIKIDPDVLLGTGIPGTEAAIEVAGGQAVVADLRERSWFLSPEQIQFRNTVMIDLSPSEERLLANLKQKTRYNLRLAQKKGVRVRVGTLEDLPLLYRMYAETSVRDEFVIREESYYQLVWRTFMGNPALPGALQPFSEPLIAEVEGEAIAAVSVFYFAGQAIYLFGMSRPAQREKMPNYLLQWEAMRRAKSLGCTLYNLWGAPDEFNEQDSLWGVFRFKEGLGGMVWRTPGAWDFTPRPLLHRLYTQALPRVMDVMRLRGRKRTRQFIS